MSAAGAPRPGGGAVPAALAIAALAAAALLAGILLRPGGGLRGRYAFLDAGGAEVLIHTRIDPVIDFASPQRLDAAYIFHWDVARYGFPASLPPYVIRWNGLVRAPRPGRYGFAVEAQGEALLRLDGRPIPLPTDALAEIDLQSGLHAIDLEYRLQQGEARLVLRWRPPGGGALRPIPAGALWPDAAAPAAARGRRLAGWGLLAAGAALAAALAAQARRGRGFGARVAAFIDAERPRLAIGSIAVLALALRLHDYALVPFHHETADEYQHAWEGWHLLHDGVPAAWSTFPDRYPAGSIQDFRWFGDRYVVVRPYFDHPPLFSIPVGLFAALAGARHPLESNLPAMRLVPILLSVAGVFLLQALARRYGAGERGALLAALVYATLPILVVAHRLVKAESLLAILFMGGILLAERHAETGRPRDAWLAALLGGLSIWTKATGVAVPAVLVVLLLSRGRRRAALLAAATAAGFLGLYVLYGAAYDFDIFRKVLAAQATTKWVSLDGLLDLLNGKIVVKYFGRGWYLWLLLCAGVAAFRRERALLLPIALYATVLALTADSRVIYGWYRIPIVPFLCVAAGIYLDEMLREADLPRVFPFAVAAVATGLVYAFRAHPYATAAESAFQAASPISFAQTKTAVALFALLALAPYLPRWIRETAWTVRLARGATAALFLLFLLANLATVRDLLEIYAATRGIQ